MKSSSSQNKAQLAGSIRSRSIECHLVSSSAVVSCTLTAHMILLQSRTIDSETSTRSISRAAAACFPTSTISIILLSPCLSLPAPHLHICLFGYFLSICSVSACSPCLPLCLPPAYSLLIPPYLLPACFFLAPLTTVSSSLSHPPLYTLKVSNCSDTANPHNCSNIFIGILFSQLWVPL